MNQLELCADLFCIIDISLGYFKRPWYIPISILGNCKERLFFITRSSIIEPLVRVFSPNLLSVSALCTLISSCFDTVSTPSLSTDDVTLYLPNFSMPVSFLVHSWLSLSLWRHAPCSNGPCSSWYSWCYVGHVWNLLLTSFYAGTWLCLVCGVLSCPCL